jgi:hypothetical protein
VNKKALYLKSLKAIPTWNLENTSYPVIRTTENALEAIIHKV